MFLIRALFYKGRLPHEAVYVAALWRQKLISQLKIHSTFCKYNVFSAVKLLNLTISKLNCTANGVFFLPIIIGSNGYIHPRQFLQDLANQTAFYRHIPWHNLYLFYLSLICFILLSALS